jgi:acetylornithine deacetylase/succinyl-diaminopimelate desuccinylase-like protein
MDQWHSADERIAVPDLIDGAVGYLGLIEEYLGA